MHELLKKMNYKRGSVVALGAPAEFEPVISQWKAEVVVERALAGAKPSFLVVFVKDAKAVQSAIPQLVAQLGADTIFWIAFPKQSSPRYKSDINRDTLWDLVSPLGLRPNRNIAIDDDWSALRFAVGGEKA